MSKMPAPSAKKAGRATPREAKRSPKADQPIQIPNVIEFEVTGTVQGFGASGIGPNSGELTVVIQQPTGDIVEVFAGILGASNPGANGIEQGVYATYASIVLAALASGRKLSCSYLLLDKPRINGMTIVG